MNTNPTAVIATERQQRYLTEAAEYRRSHSDRKAEPQRRAPKRSHRISTFLKDLAAASL